MSFNAFDEYFKLLALILTGMAYDDPPIDPWHGTVVDATGRVLDVKSNDVPKVIKYPVTVGPGKYDAALRALGRDWPATALTMTGFLRLMGMKTLVLDEIVKWGIKGDFIETGVWRGGTCIFLRKFLDFYGERRKIFVADSFKGLAEPNAKNFPADDCIWWHNISPICVDRKTVEANLHRYGCLDERMVFVEGYFKESLPPRVHAFYQDPTPHDDSGNCDFTFPDGDYCARPRAEHIGKLALLRFDGDSYETTLDVLNTLYGNVTPGGFILIDDYGHEHEKQPARAAVHDFRAARKITTPIVDIADGQAVFWRKT